MKQIFHLSFFPELHGTVTSNCRNLFNLFIFSTILSEPAMPDVRIYPYMYEFLKLIGTGTEFHFVRIFVKYGFSCRFLRKHEVLVLLQFGYAGKTRSEVMFNTILK